MGDKGAGKKTRSFRKQQIWLALLILSGLSGGTACAAENVPEWSYEAVEKLDRKAP